MVAVEDRSPQGRGYSDFAGDTPASAAVDLMHHSLLLPAPGTTAGPRAAYDDCLAAGVRYKGARYSETIKRRFGKMPGVVKFQLTNHARKAVAERQIPIEWIERTLDGPELIVRDPNDPTIQRCFRRIVSRSLPLVLSATSRLYRPCRSPQSLHS
jgi:hypothetical protein